MTPEDVAKANQFREGFSLVDYREVGLPVFRLTIEAITLSQRGLPTIHEFVMRCLKLGEVEEPAIARMLGLREDVVTAAMNSLIADGYAARLSGASNVRHFELTEAGVGRLDVELLEIPQEEMLVVDYDGIQRKPIRLAGTTVVRAGDLRAGGGLEVRPYPAESPSIDDLSIPDVTKVVRRQGNDDFRRTVLALNRVVRRNHVFREAVGLVFVADRGDEVQVAFAIDGKISDPHERAFAENGGPRKMGFIKALVESDPGRSLERLLGRQSVRSFAPKAEVRTELKAQAVAEAAVRQAAPAAQESPKGSPAKIAYASARDDLQKALADLARHPARELQCFEQATLLLDALEAAKARLWITSSGLQPHLLNGYVLHQIDQLIERGVDVHIQVPPVSLDKKADTLRYDPRAELAKRTIKGAPVLMSGLKRDWYFLVKDHDLAVVSNKPFFGDIFLRTGFMFVSGAVIRDPDMVKELARQLSEPKGTKSA